MVVFILTLVSETKEQHAKAVTHSMEEILRNMVIKRSRSVVIDHTTFVLHRFFIIESIFKSLEEFFENYFEYNILMTESYRTISNDNYTLCHNLFRL